MSESFVSYRSFHEALKDLTIEQYGRVMYAINEYALNQVEMELNKTEKAIFNLMKPKIIAGIKYLENRKQRSSEEYKVWRLTVFQRDSFTCQKCNRVGGKLNAHHIKRFAKDKENRMNIDNGITLCEKCHKELHRLEGK